MNVFVLSPGRCGSATFWWACSHITNFKAGHETNVRKLGAARVDYPENFIEVDSRLAWVLGRLNERYGDDAFYVHLTRDPDAIALSYNKRWHIPSGIIPAYRSGVLMLSPAKPIQICRDYVETVTANIRTFLLDKTNVLNIALETMTDDFPRFWNWIGATGDFDAAMREWSIKRNLNEEQ
jgi:hypothetical protein